MSETDRWLAQAKARADVLSEACRRQLDTLWWVNLMFVVTPAVGSAAAAIVAALPEVPPLPGFPIPVTSVLAGGSAVLLAIHKALKCDEYQAECVRISQAYESLAVRLDSARYGPEEQRDVQRIQLTSKLAALSQKVKAKLPARHRNWVERRQARRVRQRSDMMAA